jgi:hypothetical protein
MPKTNTANNSFQIDCCIYKSREAALAECEAQGYDTAQLHFAGLHWSPEAQSSIDAGIGKLKDEVNAAFQKFFDKSILNKIEKSGNEAIDVSIARDALTLDADNLVASGLMTMTSQRAVVMDRAEDLPASVKAILAPTPKAGSVPKGTLLVV